MHVPTIESHAFRANLAILISPLKRVRSRVPFWQLASHRTPTLHLYRNLLRSSWDENIRFRVRMLFRQYRHLTSPTAARVQLTICHKLLDTLTNAQKGDVRSRLVLGRYAQMIGAKREKERWKQAFRNQLGWEKKMRNRPILTGTFVRPSYSNKPFPRMRPQPKHVSLMIRKRRLLRMRRIDKWKLLTEWRKDLQLEKKFETALAAGARFDGFELEKVFRDNAWDAHLEQLQHGLQETFDRDVARRDAPFPPELIAQVKEARREKYRNKAKESERERRGEELNRTLKRRRKGPPAPILGLMTDEQKIMDKVARSVSEVGYVAMVKRKLGFKLRDPTRWTCELGPRGQLVKMNAMEKTIREENLRRRNEG